MMQTRCPTCRSLFRISHQQLSAADGLVRCGKCGAICNGYENMKRASNGASIGAPGCASYTATSSAGPSNRAGSAILRSPNPNRAMQNRQAPSPQVAPGKSKIEPRSLVPLQFYLSPESKAPRRGWRMLLYGAMLLMLNLAATVGYVSATG